MPVKISALTPVNPKDSDKLELAQDNPGGWATKGLLLSDLAAHQKSTARQYTAQQNFSAQTLTDGANVSWDLDTQQVANVTLGGNRTLDNPTNMVNGGNYSLIVRQDATGGRTLSFGTAYLWPSGTAPTLSSAANAVDILSFISDGVNMYGLAEFTFK